MSRRGALILWSLVLLLGAAALALSATSARAAHRRLTTELERLSATQAQAREIADLRGRTPAWTRRTPPQAQLATRVGDALAGAGLPAAALASLSPEAEADLGGRGDLRARRRRAVVTLSGVTLPQVGGFLASWRELEPAWTVAGVELMPDPTHRPPAGGGDVPLRAKVDLEALYAVGEAIGAERRR